MARGVLREGYLPAQRDKEHQATELLQGEPDNEPSSATNVKLAHFSRADILKGPRPRYESLYASVYTQHVFRLVTLVHGECTRPRDICTLQT